MNMDEIQKLLQRTGKKDRDRLLAAFMKIKARDFEGLQRLRLKGYEDIYRVRIGRFRIIYFDDGEQIILKAIRKRDESTYSDF